MGATQSSTQTSTDIATSVISNVVVNVINTDSTTVNASNDLIADCSSDVNIAATQACSSDTIAIAKLIANASPEIAKILNNSMPPASCSMTCQATDIDMINNVNINVSSINDNTLANKIKSDLTAKLEQLVTNKTDGGIGLTTSQVDAITKLKTYVENNFDTKIVNETLKNFTFTQTIKATNQKISRVNMKIASTVLGNAMITNAVKNDSKVQSLIDAAVTTTAETSGFNFSLFGGIAGIVGFLAIVFIIIFIGPTRIFGFFIPSRNSNSNTQLPPPRVEDSQIVEEINLPVSGMQPT